ncbi:hypothetical protein 12VC501_gene0102 [Vibrio phage 12VC501]|nr:hypothetical protein 12VC501_gene0102 [Vibrio phage 12VC501]
MTIHTQRKHALSGMKTLSNHQVEYLQNAVKFVRSQYKLGRNRALFDDASSQQVEAIIKHIPRICNYFNIPIQLKVYNGKIPEINFID